MADLAIKKCRCCRQDINNIKHVVNLFGDKSFKEGIKEGLERYGGIPVEEDSKLSLVCQQCYNLIHSIVDRIKKLRDICCQSLIVAGKRSVSQRSPSQLTLLPSYRALFQKRQREQSGNIRQCLFLPVVSSDILPKTIQMNTIDQVQLRLLCLLFDQDKHG